MAQSFGELLKEARENRGLSTGQLAQATKILEPFIVALENEDFESLPGRVFGRGFVRSIARSVGADEQALLIAFDEAQIDTPKVVATERQAAIELDPQRQVIKENITRFIKSIRPIGWIGSGASLLSFVAIGLGLYSYLSSPGTEEKLEPANKPVEEVALKKAEPQEIAQAKPEEPKAQKPKPVVVAKTGSQMVEIKVKEQVKLRHAIDTEDWETINLEPNTYQYKFSEYANFLVFDAAAVDVSYNGKPLGQLGDKGKVRRISFKAGGESTTKKL